MYLSTSDISCGKIVEFSDLPEHFKNLKSQLPCWRYDECSQAVKLVPLLAVQQLQYLWRYTQLTLLFNTEKALTLTHIALFIMWTNQQKTEVTISFSTSCSKIVLCVFERNEDHSETVTNPPPGMLDTTIVRNASCFNAPLATKKCR